MSKKNNDGFFETVKTIFWAGLIALCIRTFAYEPFNIPSSSMEPTLLIGDYLFVSKFSYGYSQYSFPLGLGAFMPEGRIMASLPERGDVAVFKQPFTPEIDYIKRIVGLPGDRIQVKRGILHINDEPVSRTKLGDYNSEHPVRMPLRGTMFTETLPDGRQHLILEKSDFASQDNTRVYTVPPDHVFAMGDNRDGSKDSRFLAEVGFVPVENLVGRAEFLFFSTDGSARLWEIWKWPLATRFERLFSGIE